MCLIFSQILAFDSGRKTLCLLQKCKIMYENIVLSFFKQNQTNIAMIFGGKCNKFFWGKQTFTQVGFPQHRSFFSKKIS